MDSRVNFWLNTKWGSIFLSGREGENNRPRTRLMSAKNDFLCSFLFKRRETTWRDFHAIVHFSISVVKSAKSEKYKNAQNCFILGENGAKNRTTRRIPKIDIFSDGNLLVLVVRLSKGPRQTKTAQEKTGSGRHPMPKKGQLNVIILSSQRNLKWLNRKALAAPSVSAFFNCLISLSCLLSPGALKWPNSDPILQSPENPPHTDKRGDENVWHHCRFFLWSHIFCTICLDHSALDLFPRTKLQPIKEETLKLVLIQLQNCNQNVKKVLKLGKKAKGSWGRTLEM